MEARTKHKLALAAGAGIVGLTAYAILTTQGDSAASDPMTIGGGGLGGFGDLFRKLLGSGGGGSGLNLGDASGLSPYNPNLPVPNGDEYTGPAIDTYAPPVDTTTSYVQQFKQSLTDLLTPATTTQGPTAASAMTTAEGGFNYTLDQTPTGGGASYLPNGIVQTPAGLNTFTATVNPTDYTWPNGEQMTTSGPLGQTVYTGPTGYVDVSGNQYYQAQYGQTPSNTVMQDLLPAGSGGPSNALAYVPNTGAPVYQNTPNGFELVAPGTQLPAPSQDSTQFQGYGLVDISGQPLTGMGFDPNAEIAPQGAMALVPLANSNSPDNWVGSQGHNPNNPYDTN